MLGLLEAYASDKSGSSESESESNSEKPDKSPPAIKLPNPFDLPSPRLDGTSKGLAEKSVFVNPYVQADVAKKALLEKHVKMISTDFKVINGKKICWNYRKRRCRFGHNCKYAHDSDLQTEAPSPVVNDVRQAPPPESHKLVDEGDIKSGKKRPGLSATIVPSKKVIKNYFEQKKASK